MDKNWSEIQQKRVGTYERNLKIQKIADMGIPYEAIGNLQKPAISRQRICQILQRMAIEQEKKDANWSAVRDAYGTEGVEENDR